MARAFSPSVRLAGISRSPAPAQADVRALLLDVLARELLLSADVASRLGVHRSVVSRFQRGLLSFPPSKLAELEAFLLEVASGRVVVERALRRAQLAKAATELAARHEALFASVPGFRTRGEEIAAALGA